MMPGPGKGRSKRRISEITGLSVIHVVTHDTTIVSKASKDPLTKLEAMKVQRGNSWVRLGTLRWLCTRHNPSCLQCKPRTSRQPGLRSQRRDERRPHYFISSQIRSCTHPLLATASGKLYNSERRGSGHAEALTSSSARYSSLRVRQPKSRMNGTLDSLS